MQPFAMRIIFALMDRDGDGTVSLQEFQAAGGELGIGKSEGPASDAPRSETEIARERPQTLV